MKKRDYSKDRHNLEPNDQAHMDSIKQEIKKAQKLDKYNASKEKLSK